MERKPKPKILALWSNQYIRWGLHHVLTGEIEQELVCYLFTSSHFHTLWDYRFCTRVALSCTVSKPEQCLPFWRMCDIKIAVLHKRFRSHFETCQKTVSTESLLLLVPNNFGFGNLYWMAFHTTPNRHFHLSGVNSMSLVNRLFGWVTRISVSSGGRRHTVEWTLPKLWLTEPVEHNMQNPRNWFCMMAPIM